jgi:hypothetical protein
MQQQVVQWLCEGIGNTEVTKLLADAHGVEVTRQAIDHYRTTYAEEIDTAREEALRRAVQQGYANRLRRLEVLSRNADRASELTRAGGQGWTTMSAELRAILKDIRDELGDLKQRHEHTGAGGGAITIDDQRAAADKLAGLLTRVADADAEDCNPGGTD